MTSQGFVPWNNYWDKKDVLHTDRGDFNMYSTQNETQYLCLCIHGAGHSALSFSLLAQQLRSVCTVYAPDLKCHGDTPGNPGKDLSIADLTLDCVSIGKSIIQPGKKLILIGHSLGGSIVAHAAKELKPMAIMVIDTIEGTAIAAMPGMRHILTSRPTSFKSAEAAIRYLSSSGEMSNKKSAEVSGAGRIYENESGQWVWRTNLLPSEDFWVGWFKGFADTFLKAPGYKILVLPNIDRLDTPFTIGHMSGKFQLEIVHGTYHCMHEDRPEDIASIIKHFLERMAEVPQWK